MSSKNQYVLEKHPFEDFINEDTETLIIGTFPTAKRNREFEFYYAGKTSHFWNIIQKIFSVTFQKIKGENAIEERKSFSRQHKIGFTDMLVECYRLNNSSSDNDLYPVKIKDIDSILINNSTIKTIVFTSRTEAVGALGLFQTSLYVKGKPFLQMGYHKGIKDSIYHINDRSIEILVPYSPADRVIEKNELKRVTEMYGYALKGFKI